MEQSRLLLQSGKGHYLYSSKNGNDSIDYFIKNPKFSEILDLEEKEIGLYYKYLYPLVTTSLDVADILFCEADIWYEDIKNEWEFFLQKIMSDNPKKIKVVIRTNNEMGTSEIVIDGNAVNDLYRDSLNFFFNTNGEYIIWGDKNNEVNSSNSVYLMNVTAKEKRSKKEQDSFLFNENNFKLNSHFYNIMLETLRKINWIKPEYDFVKGGSKYAKKYILKQNYKDRNKNKKATMDLSSIISSLVAKGQRYEDILNYSIYLIYDLYYRLVKIDEWDNTMTALNSGYLDTKKNPINFEKINWAAIIN